MTLFLALGAAALYGLSDFLGGVLARRASVWAIAVTSQVAAAVLTAAAVAFIPGDPTAMDMAWGAIAGVGGGVGTGFLYRGLANGRMAVVAPLSAVGAAVLPVAVGFLTGERPATLTWVGIIAAFPAIWLVSTIPDTGPSGARSRSVDAGVVDGLLAGLGFGLLFSTLGQVPDGAGLAPLAAAQSTSVLAIAALATSMREPWVPRERSVLPALIVGALVAAAALLFLLATQSGLLTVASVVTSLYPAFTVLLAATLLRERVHRAQTVGMVLALTAVALIAAG